MLDIVVDGKKKATWGDLQKRWQQSPAMLEALGFASQASIVIISSFPPVMSVSLMSDTCPDYNAATSGR